MKILTKRSLGESLLPFSAIMLFLCFSLLLTSFVHGDTVTYEYDSLNRLTGTQYSNGTVIEYSYDAAGNMLSMSSTVVLTATCAECANSPVNLTNVTFDSGTTCVCKDAEYITIGKSVTIKSGANIIFQAPKVNIQSGFHAEKGAVVQILQQ